MLSLRATVTPVRRTFAVSGPPRKSCPLTDTERFKTAMRFSTLTKKIAGSAFVGAILSGLITFYIWLVISTSRRTDIGRDIALAAADEPSGLIVAFWHQRLLLAVQLRRETNRKVYMLVSANRDGEIIANAVRPFGVEMIRGSAANPRKADKSKSGAPALTQMIAALNEGAIVGVTPDGPRGPRGRAHMGAVRLARLSGAPILPIAYAASSGRFLERTWDRFLAPFPFGRTAFVAAEPIRVAGDAAPETLEKARAALESALTDATGCADSAVGRSPDDAGLARMST